MLRLLGLLAALALALWQAVAWTVSPAKKRRGQDSRRALEFQAFRISNIPHDLHKNEFRDILLRLPSGNTVSEIPDQPNVLGWSFTPAAASSLSGRFRVATVTFRVPPVLAELETAIRRECGSKAGRVMVDSDFLGLTPLADPKENAGVDVIAVTGLAGHAFGSWKAKGHPDMWLRDFLPESIPTARIMTYGYDTKLPGSQSDASIIELSRKLLESIKTTRDTAAQSRPLILIGHSLGGLVIKQALVQASEGGPEDKAIFMSCCAVILFAVPNRGLENESLMAMVKGQPNEDLVRTLSGDSAFARLLHERFYSLFKLDGTKIVSIFETLRTPTVKWSPDDADWKRTGPKIMMVPQTSAIYAGPNEKSYDQLSRDANHSDIVKFSDQSDYDYVIIEARIIGLVAIGPEAIKERFASHRTKLSAQAAQYIQALKAPDYKALRNKFEDPTPGTLGWFLKDKDLCAWQASDKSSILRIEGSAGQGKTILTKFLLRNLEQTSTGRSISCAVVYFFFYDQDDNYRTVSGALRSLIKQLLSIRDAFQILSQTADIESSAITEDSLWSILEDLLRAPIFNTIYCILDALDECQNSPARLRLLTFIKKLVQRSTMTREKYPVFKVITVSRPMVELTRALDQFPLIQLKANPHDLEIFIRREVTALKLDGELHETAIELLLGRVEQTFLWISIVVKKLRRTTALLSPAGLAKIIDETPSDLTKLYEGIVSRIIEDDDVAAQKLLTWVAFSRRALTLGELEEALAIQEDSDSKASTKQHRIRLTAYTVTNAVGVILEISADYRVYLIHQSAKQFLHKSGHLASAEFSRGLLPGAYLAKVCMIYLCFQDFKPEYGREPMSPEVWNCQHPFLRYAARNWHRHIVDDDDAKRLTELIRRLTEPHSPTLLAWGEAAGIHDLDKAANTWDVAMKADIPWLVDFQSGGGVISEGTVINAAKHGIAGWNSLRRLVNNRAIHFSERVICAIVQHFDQEMVRLLLHNHGTAATGPALLTAATRNHQQGTYIMYLLLEDKPRFEVTAQLVRLAAENDTSGKDIVELLLRYDGAHFSEVAVAEVAKRFGAETMRVVLSSRENVKVTEMIFKAATENMKSCREIMTLLLEQDQAFPVTEELVRKVTFQFDSSIMEALLEKRCEDLQITEEMIRIIATWCDERVVGLLLNRRGNEITVTEDVLKAAAGNTLNVMELLLDHWGSEAIITEGILIRAAKNPNTGYEVTKLLLCGQGREITITEGVLKAAAGNGIMGGEIMKLLLHDQRRNNIITEGVLIAIARNRWHGERVMKLLLDHHRSEITITEGVLIEAAGNQWADKKVMKLLLDRHGSEITITEGVLIAAAGIGPEVIELLLHDQRRNIRITEGVLIAAAGNRWTGTGVIKLLLNSWENEIIITEGVLTAAAGNEECGTEILEGLLDYWKPEIIITERVLTAAAGNEGCGTKIMERLLDYWKPEIIITERVLTAAAGNRKKGYGVMKRLLDYQEKKIIITEGVLIAAAGNPWQGKQVMELLLGRQKNEIIITEGVLTAAAGNEIYGKAVMALLEGRASMPS